MFNTKSEVIFYSVGYEFFQKKWLQNLSVLVIVYSFSREMSIKNLF